MTRVIELGADLALRAAWGPELPDEGAVLVELRRICAEARAGGPLTSARLDVPPRSYALDLLDLADRCPAGGFLAMLREVGDAEAALQRSEARYRALFETTGTATFTFGPDTVISLVNSEFERRTGTRREEVVGIRKATEFVDPADLQAVMTYHRLRSETPEQAPESYEIRVHDGQGRPRIGIFTIKLVPGTGERVVSFVDVTEQRQARQQVLRAEKLAALGQLMSGLTHEIANPTNFIQFNVPILRRALEAVLPLAEVEAARVGVQPLGQPFDMLAADVRGLLDDIERGSGRIAELIEQLRSHVRQGEPRPLAPGSVLPCAQRALALAGPQVRKLALLESAFEEDLPEVMLDPGKLEQVLVNLLVNAAQAARGADAWVRLVLRRAEERGQIELSVADNGTGIPAGQIEQIFDPFFTTKEQGTGLGLWICHQIVEEHGGRLLVESEPGVGTVFRVRLPGVA